MSRRFAMSSDEDVDTAGADGDRRRDRSPNYPSIGFTEALALAKKIFDKDRRHPMTADTAARHLGYGGVNGTSKVIVSALRKYGLLEAHNGQLKISDDAAGLILLGKDNPERQEKLRRLALRPPLFQEITREYPDGLPSDENLSSTLQYRYGFTATAAARVIESLRDSIAAAEGRAVEGPQREPAVDDAAGATDAPARDHIPSAPTVATGPGLHEVWDLGDGVRAELRIAGAFGPDQLEVLNQYIQVLAFKVARNAKKASDAGQ
jgi:hypothetical protein